MRGGIETVAIFGNQLKAARAIVDISQGVLAKEVGINQATLRRMEGAGAGLAKCRLTTMQAILQALGKRGVVLTHRGVELVAKSESPAKAA
jgi:predicted transcriptional regulator